MTHETVEACEAVGFALTGTGGDCTAWMRHENEGGEILITSADGEPIAPDDLREPCTVSWWNADGEEVRVKHFDTLEAGLYHLEAEDFYGRQDND